MHIGQALKMAKLLILEDESDTRELLVTYLSRDHQVDAVSDGDGALQTLEYADYDLLILDWNTPNRSGLSVCEAYRTAGGSSPVLFLTGRTAFLDKEQGFVAGADDYLTKPYDLREVALRVNALLRRRAVMTDDILHCGSLRLDRRSKILFKDNIEIHLSPKEYQLLELFMVEPSQTFSAESIARRLWGLNADATAVNARIQVKRLRERIDSPERDSFIKNVHGHGYALNP